MATRLLEKYKWTKDGRRWVFYTWEKTLDGKKYKKFSQAYFTKKEAQEAERKYLGQMNKKLFEQDKNMTFKDLYVAYLDYQSDKVKATTIRTYNDRIRYMKIFEDIKLKDLSAYHYQSWRKELNKTNISTNYKNHIQKFLKIVLNWGKKMYGYDFSDFYEQITKFNNPNEIEKEMEYFTLEEFQQFISKEKDIKFKCLFETLYYCGLRKGEARAITWKDINFKEKTLRINKNVTTIGSESSKEYSLTKSSIRTLPIPNVLLNDFKLLLQEDKTIYGFQDNWFVFGIDTPITDSKIRCHKNSICRKSGVKQIRIHDFRHSCASLLINNGANITIRILICLKAN